MNTKKVFLSDKYMVKVKYKNGDIKKPSVYVTLEQNKLGNYIKIPDEIYREFDGIEHVTNGTKAYFVSFEADDEVSVEVKLPDDTTSAIIKPLSYNINCKIENGVATFDLKPGQFIALEPNGSVFGELRIFCNLKKEVPQNRKNKIIFTDGIYTAENCEYIRINEHGCPVIDNIPNDTLIYVSDGAVVNASIYLKGARHITIAGSGIISTIDRCYGAENDFENEIIWGGFRYYALPSVFIKSGCYDIVIEDVILNSEFRGVTIRNSDNITLRDMKIFTSCVNADGINCYNTRHILVEGCFIRSSDDCFCMYNAGDSIPNLFDTDYEYVTPLCADAEVKNCIMVANSRPVVLGGHATGNTSPRCVVEDVYIHDCEIIATPGKLFINNAEHASYWSGFMRILSQSEQIVRNIKFENIVFNITNGYMGKLVHIDVRSESEASYSESRGYRIENVTFKNIHAIGYCNDLLPSLIKCRKKASGDDTCGVSDIVFENVTIDKKKLKKDDIIIDGNVENVDFK